MSDDSSYESPEESLDELSDGSSEDSPSPLLRKSLPQNKPSSLVPEKIPEHVEFDIKPMKIIFDHMSSEITKLKAEKESYKNKYLEQQKIANSLNAQIHDNHSLVTESSLVKELRAELVGRRLSHRSDRARFDQHLDEVGREIREYRQRLTADMETKQRKTRENVLKLKEMVEHYRLRLQEANRELHHKKVAMHQKKVAHYRDMQAYRNHVRSSWQEMLRSLVGSEMCIRDRSVAISLLIWSNMIFMGLMSNSTCSGILSGTRLDGLVWGSNFLNSGLGESSEDPSENASKDFSEESSEISSKDSSGDSYKESSDTSRCLFCSL